MGGLIYFQGITMAGAAKKQAVGPGKASESEAQLQLLSGLVERCLDQGRTSQGYVLREGPFKLHDILIYIYIYIYIYIII